MSTGAASVLAWTGAATTAVAAVSLIGATMIAQARADTAADLAALAGADALAVAAGDPCATAARTAERNGGRLVSCELREWDVLVRVEVSAPGPFTVEARARAGPGPSNAPDLDGGTS